MVMKYGLASKWESNRVNLPHVVGCWKGIMDQLNSFKKGISMGLVQELIPRFGKIDGTANAL